VDEVLAVGDISFQAKCFDKIREFADSGRTIIFISHALHQVEKLCDRVILLMHGETIFEGEPNRAIDIYRSKVMKPKDKAIDKQLGSGEIVLSKVELVDEDNNLINALNTGDAVIFRIYYEAKEEVVNPVFSVVIYDYSGNTIVSHMRTDADSWLTGSIKGKGFLDLKIGPLNLLPGPYIFSVSILKNDGIAIFDAHYKKFRFLIEGGHKTYGLCYLKHDWSIGALKYMDIEAKDLR